MEKRTHKRGFAASSFDLTTSSLSSTSTLIGNDWWNKPADPPQLKPPSALKKFNRMCLKVKRSMSFSKAKAEAKYDENDDFSDLFYRPPGVLPYSDQDVNGGVLDINLATKVILDCQMEKEKQNDATPRKLKKLPSKPLLLHTRVLKPEELARPTRPFLRNSITSPDLRLKHHRDSVELDNANLKKYLADFPAPPSTLPPVPLRKHTVSTTEKPLEVHEKRPRFVSSASGSLSRSKAFGHSNAYGHGRKPSQVFFKDLPPGSHMGPPPLPDLPPGAARPRLPSQKNVSLQHQFYI